VIWAPFETDVHELEYGKDFGLTEMSVGLGCDAAHPLGPYASTLLELIMICHHPYAGNHGVWP
jgi:hypothetical protein